MTAQIDYAPDGDTLVRFLQSVSMLAGIVGPWGSGKSAVCCIKLGMKALGQPPGPDGIRRRRTYIVRNTYDDLNRTTVKTWLDWWSEAKVGPLKRSKPMVHEIITEDLHWEVVFLALDSPDDVKKLLSAEPSDIWFNEAREIPRELVDAGIGRIGRYPSVAQGGCHEPQVLLDTNAPPEDHYISIMSDLVPIPENLSESERLALTRPDNWEFHVQPAGVIERVDENGPRS